MCINNNGIIFQIITPIATLVGAIVGAFFTFLYSKRLIFETRRLHALDDFVGAFTDDILFIENSPPVIKSGDGYIIDPNRRFCETLIKSKSKHRKAIEIFKFYINKKKYRKIYKAYENYYNPLHMGKTKDIIEKLSFGIYNMPEDEVKKSIGKKISGEKLALENIRKIIKAAQE